MAYRIRRQDKSIEKAVRRIAREQLGKAVNAIEDSDDIAQTVHDVRKRCKKVRGLLRLVRQGFDGFDEENRAYRDIAGGLSGPREYQVALHTIDLMLRDIRSESASESLSTCRTLLEADGAAQMVQPRLALSEALDRLASARRRIKDWELDDDGWSAIEPGIGKTYRKAHSAARKIEDGDSAESYHVLRKALKYHWYHTRLLEKIRPDAMRARARMAGRLTEILGDHHDLSDLENRLEPHLEGAQRKSVEMVLILARRRRTVLEGQSHELCAKLLKKRPDDLVSDWQSDWRKWHGRR